MSEQKLSERMRRHWPPDDLVSAGWVEGEEDRVHKWADEVTALEAKLEKMGQEAKANEYALSQEANGTLCRCRYGTDMMGQVPEGSFCPFCGYRRYESVITGKWRAAAQEE